MIFILFPLEYPCFYDTLIMLLNILIIYNFIESLLMISQCHDRKNTSSLVKIILIAFIPNLVCPQA